MTTLELEHVSFSDDEPLLCACGCGQPLKEGAKRTYIHGHKLAMDQGIIANDPEPSDEAHVRASVRVTAKVKAEMQESLEAYLSLAAGMWAMSDPLCGNVAMNQSKVIAERLVPLLARNQTAVRYFRSSSTFKDTLDLILVLAPVAQMIGRHHLFHTVSINPQGEQEQVNYNAFVA